MIIHALRLWVSEIYKADYTLWYERSPGGDWVAGPKSACLKPVHGREWWQHFNAVLDVDSSCCWPPDYD